MPDKFLLGWSIIHLGIIRPGPSCLHKAEITLYTHCTHRHPTYTHCSNTVLLLRMINFALSVIYLHVYIMIRLVNVILCKTPVKTAMKMLILNTVWNITEKMDLPFTRYTKLSLNNLHWFQFAGFQLSFVLVVLPL